MALNSFDEVVSKYENTKPVHGDRRKKEMDIRPIGKRSKWWARIYKHSDNLYVLTDSVGWSMGGSGWYTWTEEDQAKYRQDTVEHAPIVWERRADGDYVSINKGYGSSTARYKFLSTWVPHGLRYLYGSGEHVLETGGECHVLHNAISRGGETTEKPIEFKHLGDGKFERVTDLYMVRTGRVDKEKTKILKPKINEMWAWMQTIMPIFEDRLNESFAPAQKKLGGWNWAWEIKPELARAILNDENHELRLDLAMACVSYIGAYNEEYLADKYRTTFHEHEKSRAKFRTLIYKLTDSYLYEPQ